MAISGQTLFRFCGAVLLGLGASRIDRPTPLAEPTQPDSPPRTRSAVVIAPRAYGVEWSIAPGMRAMAIPIRGDGSFVELVQPNVRVDVVLITEDGGRRVAKLIEQNLRVLAIEPMGLRIAQRDGGESVAVLEVTPELGATLAEARTRGVLTLMLRGNDARERAPAPQAVRLDAPR